VLSEGSVSTTQHATYFRDKEFPQTSGRPCSKVPVRSELLEGEEKIAFDHSVLVLPPRVGFLQGTSRPRICLFVKLVATSGFISQFMLAYRHRLDLLSISFGNDSLG
jgi:hypothetical protein